MHLLIASLGNAIFWNMKDLNSSSMNFQFGQGFLFLRGPNFTYIRAFEWGTLWSWASTGAGIMKCESWKHISYSVDINVELS